MSFLIPRDYATIFLDGAVITLMVSIMIMSSETRKRDRDDDRFFFILLVLGCVLAVSEIMGYLFEEKTLPGSWILSTIGMTVYYLAYIMTGIVWNQYCRIRFKFKGISSESIMRPAYIPGAVMMALVVINIFTGWLFSYDKSAFYHRGPLYLLLHVAFIVYVGVGFFHIIRYRNAQSGKTVIPVWVYILPVVFGIVFTFAIPGSASFGPLGIALCIAFTHIGTTNEVLVINYNKEKAANK